jgi:uncharacterized membrane protein
MPDAPTAATPTETLPPAGDPADAATAKLIYILYLISLVVGVTALIGVVMAYVKKDEAPAWVRTHYRFQIRTFWIGVLYSFIGAGTSLLFVGYAILLFVVMWLIVRCIKGMGWAERGEPVRNVTTWLFP